MSTIIFPILPLILTLGCSGSDKSTESGTGDSGTEDSATEDSGTAALTSSETAGHWVSGGCEAYDDGQGGKNYLLRDFTLTETDWHLELGLFGDEGCSYGLFKVVIDGPYALGDLSSVTEGATEGTFSFKSNVWTALDQGLADTFTGAGCGSEPWVVGEPQDVTQTGCIGVAHPIADCPSEYDIVGLRDSKLYFGERITDMCSEAGRPKALGAYGLDAR